MLKYELTHLLWCERTERDISNMFGMTIETGMDLPCGYYTLLDIVLDDMGVPEDVSFEQSRDAYNDLYYEFLTSHYDDYEPSDEDLEELLKQFEELRDECRHQDN